jgi:hypothetical protein
MPVTAAILQAKVTLDDEAARAAIIVMQSKAKEFQAK